MDDWYRLQQEAINFGETLLPMSYQVIPPTHPPEHIHSQEAQSAMQIPPVQFHGFQRDARNVINVNLTSYIVRGDTSRALQRSEVGESHQHVHGEVWRSYDRISPNYSQQPRNKMAQEFQVPIAKS